MIYESNIVKALEKVKLDLDSLNISQHTRCINFYNAATREEKNNYISNYESFFHIIGTFRFIFDDLLIISKKLENIRIQRDVEIKNNGQMNNKFNEILHLTCWFYNSITILIKILEDNKKKIKFKAIKRDYPEIFFVKSLRNSFLQHPKFLFPFKKVSSSSISEDKGMIPYAQIAPGSECVFIFEHYKNLIKDNIFLNKKRAEQLHITKNIFINLKQGRWRNFGYKPNFISKIKSLFKKKNINTNRELDYKIKLVGLPNVDQIKLSGEILNIFNKVILPFLKQMVVEAKTKNILFD